MKNNLFMQEVYFITCHHTIQEIGYDFGVDVKGKVYEKKPVDLNIGDTNQITEEAIEFLYNHLPEGVKIAGDDNSIISSLQIN